MSTNKSILIIGDTRNAQRQSNVVTILNGVNQYVIDNNGNLPSSLDGDPNTAEMIGSSSNGCDACTAVSTDASCIDLADDLVPIFLANIPFDPQSGSASITGYYINETDAGRITVGACEPEQDAVIEVTR